MGSGPSKSTLVRFAEHYDSWSPSAKLCLDQCVQVMEKAISDKKDSANFSWDYQDDRDGRWSKGTTPSLRHITKKEVDWVYSTITNYYANERDFKVNMGGYNIGSGVSIYKFDLIDENYLLKHEIPSEDDSYLPRMKHMRSQFMLDFLPIVEKRIKDAKLQNANLQNAKNIEAKDAESKNIKTLTWTYDDFDLSKYPEEMSLNDNLSTSCLSISRILKKRHGLDSLYLSGVPFIVYL